MQVEFIMTVRPNVQQARLNLTKVPYFIFCWRSQTNKSQLTEIYLDPTEVKLLINCK